MRVNVSIEMQLESRDYKISSRPDLNLADFFISTTSYMPNEESYIMILRN